MHLSPLCPVLKATLLPLPLFIVGCCAQKIQEKLAFKGKKNNLVGVLTIDSGAKCCLAPITF
jgi:hypothetical protein